MGQQSNLQLFYHESAKGPRLNRKKGLTGQAKTRKKEKFRAFQILRAL
jgi:hypothetical protein